MATPACPGKQRPKIPLRQASSRFVRRLNSPMGLLPLTGLPTPVAVASAFPAHGQWLRGCASYGYGGGSVPDSHRLPLADSCKLPREGTNGVAFLDEGETGLQATRSKRVGVRASLARAAPRPTRLKWRCACAINAAVEASISGFLELLPEQELVQQHLIAAVKRQFELHGFAPLQTRSVERVEDLLNQGDTDKEIYGLHRLAEEQAPSAAKLALHYDLTVPFARYVREHQHQLVFPFRRYQVQPAWRGERPQLGRYREFIQADADIIARDELPVEHDAEMVSMLGQTLAGLPIPPVRLMINNRKLLEGFYLGLGITAVTETLRIVDKLPKLGESGVREALSKAGLGAEQIERCLAISQLESRESRHLREQIEQLGVEHELLTQGLNEVCLVLDRAAAELPGGVVAALHIARGFDYYTGTVVEGVLRDHPQLGSICSGGRYDNLASTKRPLPGMGVSIGITRLMSFLLHLNLLQPRRKTPAQVFVVLHSEDQRGLSVDVTRALRRRGIACLISSAARAYGKQIQQAERLGIDYVWFPAQHDKLHSVKDLATGQQMDVELQAWEPDVARLDVGQAIQRSSA